MGSEGAREGGVYSSFVSDGGVGVGGVWSGGEGGGVARGQGRGTLVGDSPPSPAPGVSSGTMADTSSSVIWFDIIIRACH